MMFGYYLDDLADDLHDVAKRKGFWEGEMTGDKIAAKIALIHSECTELLEAYRKNEGQHQMVLEISDILIRTLDLYSALNQAGIVEDSLSKVLAEKMAKNSNRENMHGHQWG